MSLERCGYRFTYSFKQRMAVSEPSLLVFTAIKYFIYIYTLIKLVVTPTITQMPTVAGQPEFETKDFKPRMKSRMISIILCDDYFHRNGYLKFDADRLNKSWGCTLGIVQLCYLDLSLHSTRKARTSYYRGADKSLARSTSRCILFDGKIFLMVLVCHIYIVLIFLQLW
jgi:hypothetical protein